MDVVVKAGLLDLVHDAAEAGWSSRRAAAVLRVDAERVGRWAERRGADRFARHGAGRGAALGQTLPGAAVAESAEPLFSKDLVEPRRQLGMRRFSAATLSTDVRRRLGGFQWLITPGLYRLTSVNVCTPNAGERVQGLPYDRT